ncbi:MAG TPA: bifunctional nuclease family protein [Candidatus Bacteroides merdavium]|uniref:Bifunctional nuclease family protein n=1 Tax=Candidatus Bacteroides merdavium TaxID=2838472 RepID=A0A9D2KEK0_9BACE|nr:bifunctional nuclease family protein [Candidatus Bacteroides merdavium]
MSRNKTELRVLSLSFSQEESGAYALLLGEMDGERQLAVIIGASEAQAILLEMRGLKSPRPLSHQLFASVIEALNVRLLRVLIYKVEKGLFYSYLFLQTENSIIRVDARTSDAIAIAMCLQSPIFIYEDLLEREKLNLENKKMQSDDTLAKEQPPIESIKRALEEAVEAEEYEKAALLRDLINNYKKTNPSD